MFSYVTLEQRIPEDHPLRKIRAICERALRRMEPVLATMYAERGRPSIAPERLLRAQLLMVLYSIRWETQLMEQINFNLLYRWFVGLGMDDGVWETSVFSKNRERLIAAAQASQAGTAEERRTALKMLARLKRRKRMTLGADKSYQEKSFIAALRAAGVSQHVAEYKPNAQWPTWLSDEERKDPGMAVSQKKRKLVEKLFAWMKQDRPMRQVKLRGLTRVDWLFRICAAAHDLVRLSKLIPIPAAA